MLSSQRAFGKIHAVTVVAFVALSALQLHMQSALHLGFIAASCQDTKQVVRLLSMPCILIWKTEMHISSWASQIGAADYVLKAFCNTRVAKLQLCNCCCIFGLQTQIDRKCFWAYTIHFTNSKKKAAFFSSDLCMNSNKGSKHLEQFISWLSLGIIKIPSNLNSR